MGVLGFCYSIGMMGSSQAVSKTAKGALGKRTVRKRALQKELSRCFCFSTELLKISFWFTLEILPENLKQNKTKHQNGKEKGEGTAILCYFISTFYSFKMYFQRQRLEEETRIRRIILLTPSVFFPNFTPGKRPLEYVPQSENVEASFLISKSQNGCKYLIKMKFSVVASKLFFSA